MGEYRYVTPEYAEQLRQLAKLLVTPERFGHLAVSGAEAEAPAKEPTPIESHPNFVRQPDAG